MIGLNQKNFFRYRSTLKIFVKIYQYNIQMNRCKHTNLYRRIKKTIQKQCIYPTHNHLPLPLITSVVIPSHTLYRLLKGCLDKHPSLFFIVPFIKPRYNVSQNLQCIPFLYDYRTNSSTLDTMSPGNPSTQIVTI